ncbi:MAG: PilZ domain-containing protein [Bradyrhizobium sp.]
MSHPRLYQRVKPAGLVSKKGQIIAAPKAPVIACAIVDYSPGGACLEIFPMVPVPERFELRHGSVKKKARVVWRRGIRIGVAF